MVDIKADDDDPKPGQDNPNANPPLPKEDSETQDDR